MGCCASTNTPPPSPEFHRHLSKSSRAPPPVDEETVKEVLTETPNSKPFTKIEDEPRKSTPRQSLHKIRNQPDYNHEDINVSGEVSEICSNMSESVSNTTFDEDYELLRRKVANRSPAKLRNRQHSNNNNNSGEIRAMKNSPVRGKQQSPGRVRSGSEMHNRGSGFGSTGRQRAVPGSGQASRSRSPANRTVARGGVRNGVGRSPSARKMENSPARVGSVLPQWVMKPDMSSGVEIDESGWGLTDRNVDDESLDNPLVSLECFIFL